MVEVVLVSGLHFEATDDGGSTISMDSNPDGQPEGMSPMQIMLASLGGCTGMDVISILRKKRQQVSEYRIEVSGVQATEHPHVFTDITVRHVVTGAGISEEAVRHAIELSEDKY